MRFSPTFTNPSWDPHRNFPDLETALSKNNPTMTLDEVRVMMSPIKPVVSITSIANGRHLKHFRTIR